MSASVAHTRSSKGDGRKGLEEDPELLAAIQSAQQLAASDSRVGFHADPDLRGAFPIDAFMRPAQLVAHLANRLPRDNAVDIPFEKRITREEEAAFRYAILYHQRYGPCEAVVGVGGALVDLAKIQQGKFSRGFRRAIREPEVCFKTLAQVRAEATLHS